ncbi:DUF1622 domain-containing protein [Azohydromonas australica]|uniref:DUF1622 domain-containing protein n=1 Tax=Azohydromonas australica TaxID=364039 RepID=UPI0035C196D1
MQLAADIQSTSAAPTWERIGKLAAIAVIRTALNYFLSREMKDDQAAEEPALHGRATVPDAPERLSHGR